MPYLREEARNKFIRLIDELYDCKVDTAGDMNYLFTKIMIHYLDKNGKNYQHLNNCLGALEGAKLELYRRVGGPLEDLKIHDNGDVY